MEPFKLTSPSLLSSVGFFRSFNLLSCVTTFTVVTERDAANRKVECLETQFQKLDKEKKDLKEGKLFIYSAQ